MISAVLSGREFKRISPIPGWVIDYRDSQSADTKISSTQISNGYTYTHIERQMRLKEQRAFYHYTRKIVSDTGIQNGSSISIGYDPSYEKLFFHYIDIYRDGEKISRLKSSVIKFMQRETNLERNLYDGKISAIIALKDIRKGDYIDYSFSILGENPIYKGKYYDRFYIAVSNPVPRRIFRIIAPKKRVPYFKNFNTKMVPVESLYKNEKVYLWDIKDIDGIIADSNSPSWDNPYPMVMFSEASAWSDIAIWASKNFKMEQPFSLGLTNKIEQIRSLSTQAQQIKAALTFVQQDIRYLGIETGIHNIKPFSPNIVLKRRYGDCKDKVFLLVTILNEVGVEAYPALVSTKYRDHITDFIPSPNIFNHVIAYVKLGAKEYWYDPTISSQGGTFDNIFIPNYGKALIVDTDTIKFKSVVSRGEDRTEIKEFFTITDLKSPANFKVVSTYYGAQANSQRRYFNNYSLAKVEKNYIEHYSKQYPEITASQSILVSDDKVRNIFVVTEEYSVVNVCPESSTQEGLLVCEFYPQSLRDAIYLPRSVKRSSPLWIGDPYNLKYSTEVTMPEVWPINVSQLKVGGKNFSYQSNITNSKNVVNMIYSYERFGKSFLYTDQVKQYRDKQKEIVDNLGYNLTYNLKYSKNVEENKLNWFVLILGIATFIGGVFVLRKLYRYDPEPFIGTNADERTIGGILLFLIIILFIGLFQQSIMLINADYLNFAIWKSYLDSSDLNYNPFLAFYTVCEFLT